MSRSITHPLPVCQQIALQSGLTPKVVAVSHGERSLSYRMLNECVNQLSHYLIEQGLRPGDFAAVHCGRTPEAVIAMLAIQKAGAAYLPMDSLYPMARLEYMLADSGARMVVTCGDYAKGFFETTATIIHLDTIDSELRTFNKNEPDVSIDAESAFSIIYTSGSTGQSKGAIIRHDAFENLVSWYVDVLELDSNDSVFLITSLAFDLTQKNIYAPLVAGASLRLPEEETFDPTRITQELRSTQCTVINCTPTHAYSLVNDTSDEEMIALDVLRYLVLAGEPIDISRLSRWWKRDSFSTKLMNYYGPTECTDAVAFFPISHPRDFDGKPVPIGSALPNVTMHVLDEDNHPVGTGQTGELCVSGLGVCNGYWNQSKLTAERFVQLDLPDSDDPLVYRTGDLCRVSEDGLIVFVERKDHQVKIRGLRVELGEIEVALRKLDGIKDAVVVAESREQSDQVLVAYIVPGNVQNLPDVRGIRDRLGNDLPVYMVPSKFVFIDSFPMGGSGKLDRNKLSTMVSIQSTDDLNPNTTPPRTATEKALAGVWSDVLTIETVGREDELWELGAHSLSLVRIASRIRDTFGVDIPVSVLFESIPLSELATRIESLQQRPAGTETKSNSGGEVIRRRSRSVPIPLSCSQEGLFFLEKLSPGHITYNEPQVFYLEGALDTLILGESLDFLVERHEILRTRITENNGVISQVVDEPKTGLLNVVDLSDVSEEHRMDRARDLATQLARQPIDMTKSPMMYVSLFRLSDTQHVLALVLHHIIVDGWSLEVLMRELSTSYNDFRAERSSSLEDLPIQFGDYVSWHRSRATEDAFRADLNYWRDRLSEDVPKLPFLDKSVPENVDYFEGGLVSSTLPPELVSRLTAFCRQERTTLFSTLLTVWKSLLFRYSGVNDVAVGSAIAGRKRVELEPLIGLFVNSVVLRSTLLPELTFAESVRRVHNVAIEAQEHQDLPFDMLVQELRPSRTANDIPFMQTMFVVQNTPPLKSDFDSITTTQLGIHTGASKLPVTLMVTEDEQGTHLSLEYKTCLFDAAQATRMLGHVENFLESALNFPSTSIGDLPYLDKKEEKCLIEDWNATAREYPRTSTITELFERNVVRTPEALAVCYGAEALSYAELNRRANQIARLIMNRGVNPGAIVAICMDRSINLIASILGVLKAGCAYLPLDSDCPSRRISRILNDAQAALVISESSVNANFAGHEDSIVYLDNVSGELGAQSVDDPRIVVDATTPACVLFTSGSTGGAKGVCIPHRGVLRLVINTDFADFPSLHRIAQISNMAFDAATFEMWGALLNGGTLVGIDKETALSPGNLKQKLQNERIDGLLLTPTLFNRVAASEPDAFKTVHTLVVGGEALSPKWIARVLECGGPKRLVNGYGPTEVSTVGVCHTIETVAKDATSIPIGRPISNTTAYVLDKELRLLPIGIPGELFLGGDGVALGYIGDQALTDAHFLPDPFSENPEARLYRTGDLVRYESDGTMEFLGRRDHQVKIRGFRMEPTEIEDALESCPGIGTAAVSVSKNPAGELELVAYFVSDRAEAPNPQSIRAHLKSYLPDYMIPSFYIGLDNLPLNSNGKVDKPALPEPLRSREEFGGAYESPTTNHEIQMASIWSKWLGIKQIGCNDNFFDAGGHSLLAISLVYSIQNEMGLNIVLRDLFEAPTIARLLRRIESKGDVPMESPHAVLKNTVMSDDHCIEEFRGEGDNPPFFCAVGAGSVAGYFSPLFNHLNPGQPFYGLKDVGLDENEDPTISVEDIASRYIESMRRVSPIGPYHIGGWSLGGLIAYEMAQQLTRDGETVALLVLLDVALPNVQAEAVSVSVFQRLSKVGVRAKKASRVLASVWPLVCGYLRDGTALAISKSLGFRSSEKNVSLTAREYCAWAIHDIQRQSTMKDGGLPYFGFADKRLKMIEDPFIRHVFRTMNAKETATNSYQCKPYTGKATLICADSTIEERDPRNAWERVVQGGVMTHLVPGSHDTFLLEPYVSNVAEILQGVIDDSVRN